MIADPRSHTSYYFSFRPYQRPFRHPLKTHHGEWKVREGIIIRLQEEGGRVGWGEIAPIPWFGSESIADALSCCQGLKNAITREKIASIPPTLPACRFAFESALEAIEFGAFIGGNHLPYSYLLPTGKEAIEHLQQILSHTADRTFKWKIGVNSPKTELELLEKLIPQLPDGMKLRLDANGGLSLDDARVWLSVTDQLSYIEFLEQPLPPNQFREMLSLGESFGTPLALDESVATVSQIEECYRQGWRGIFVIKPSIMGSIRDFREIVDRTPLDLVFSSSLETAIGRRSALRLAVEYTSNERAIGFGVSQYFADNLDNDTDELERLWKIF
jgi:o-succinylbenzoate synthase